MSLLPLPGHADTMAGSDCGQEAILGRSKGKEQYNRLCGKCLRACRQPSGTLLISCPRYLPRPFEVQTYRFDQLDLFGGRKK
jgi:hypothetical protein